MAKMVAFVDGGSRGNPGPSGIGVVIISAGKKIQTHKEFIGKSTNNEAEYRALTCAINIALALGATELDVFSDSLLVVNQMNLVFAVKANTLLPYWIEAQSLVGKLAAFTITHIPREQNQAADKLANEAMDLEAAWGKD